MAKSPDAISRNIAAKARDSWIKKAADFRVAAQEQAENSRIIAGNHRFTPGDLKDAQGEPVTIADRVRELNAAADAAEAKAREWDAKANPGRAALKDLGLACQ